MPLTRAAPGSPARLPHAAAVPGPRDSGRSGAAASAVPWRRDPLPRVVHGAAGPGRATRPRGTQRALLAARCGEAVQGPAHLPAAFVPYLQRESPAAPARRATAAAGRAAPATTAPRSVSSPPWHGVKASRRPALPRGQKGLGRARRRLPGASAAGGGPDALPPRSRAGRVTAAALRAGAGPELAAPRPARLTLAPPPAATREPRRRPAGGGGERSGAARHLRAPRRPRLRGSALAPPSSPRARAGEVGPGPAPRQGGKGAGRGVREAPPRVALGSGRRLGVVV